MFPSPDQPYAVAFDDDKGASYEYCQHCCVCCLQTGGCSVFCCLPCLTFCPCDSCALCQCKRCYKQDVVITDKQIEYKKGWLCRKKLNIPIELVQEATVMDDWMLRFFGIKNLLIRTETVPEASAEAYLVAPKNAEMVRDIILQRREVLLHQKKGGIYTIQGTAAVLHPLKNA